MENTHKPDQEGSVGQNGEINHGIAGSQEPKNEGENTGVPVNHHNEQADDTELNPQHEPSINVGNTDADPQHNNPENTDEPKGPEYVHDGAEEKVHVKTANYRITGIVDAFDEQGNIVSQFPIGSQQELPVEYGDRCVSEGTAERE